MLEMTETLVSFFFNDVDNITPFIWNRIVYSELNYEVINYLLYSII